MIISSSVEKNDGSKAHVCMKNNKKTSNRIRKSTQSIKFLTLTSQWEEPEGQKLRRKGCIEIREAFMQIVRAVKYG